MADDYGTDIPLNIPEAESQLDAAESQDEKPPPDPTTTETPPTAGSDDSSATGDTHKDDEYTKQLQNQYETDIKRSEAHAHDQQQYIDHFQQLQQDMANTPKPQLQQMPPAPQEQKGQVTQRVSQVLAIAAVAFSLFGKRRNGYAQGALMGGLGSLIQGYMQGNAEKHKEDTVKWHQLNESVHAENQSRLNQYKEILANKKLNMGQQMELMRMKGQFYQSNRMETNAQKQDLAAIQKHIKDMEKWQSTHAANSPMSKADGDNWRALVLEKSGGKADTKTPEGLKWAMENYPPSQYFNEKKSTHYDKKTGERSGGFTGKDGKKEKPDEKSDDPLGLGIHKPAKGAEAAGTPSVLGGGDTGGW